MNKYIIEDIYDFEVSESMVTAVTNNVLPQIEKWQLAVCMPQKDLIMVYNGDNQGKNSAKEYIIDKFFELIVRNETAGEPIHDKTDYSELLALSDKLELVCAHGEKFSNYEKEISGKFYVLGSNPMGIKKF